MKYPEGHIRKFQIRKLVAIGIIILASAITITPLLLSLFFMGIFPPYDMATTVIVLSSMFLYLVIFVTPSMLLVHSYALGPEQRELEDHVVKRIQEFLPSGLSELPEVDPAKDQSTMRWMKNPEGMRILRIKDYLTKSTPKLRCPKCKALIPFDAKFCTKCGEKTK